MSEPIEIAVLGDLHGLLAVEADAPILERFCVRLCTGDLTPNRGRTRFDEALRQARELSALRTWTVLGNHDGPTCFTGRSFPRSYRRLQKALDAHHLSGRRVELPRHGLSLVGGRPLSMGEEDLRFHPPEQEGWDLDDWGRHLSQLLLGASQPRSIVLAHNGPTGLGGDRDAIWGRDFAAEAGDWGDRDLRQALDAAAEAGRSPVAVIAGHMHHGLVGGGQRVRCRREGPTLHVNAAVVPRVKGERRAITVVRIEDDRATARQEWHGPDGEVEIEQLE